MTLCTRDLVPLEGSTPMHAEAYAELPGDPLSN